MTEPPSDKQPVFKPYNEWLDEHGMTENGESAKPPATPSTEVEPNPLPPDLRAMLWTLPLALAWLTGAYIVPHLSAHAPGAVTRSIGVALIAWVISLGCELSLAYALRASYPPLGMWQWLTHPRIARVFNRSQEAATRATNNGGVLTLLAALALPGLFTAFYVVSALMAVALQLWIGLLVIVSLTHIAITIARHQRNTRP
jgi:hypothetical protein